MSALKDFAPLAISLFALAISAYTFYAQQFRKRDKLIGHLIQVSVNEGALNTLAEYSVANIGDTQLLIKGISLLCSDGPVHLQLQSSSKNLPGILKPGDIAVFDVMYNSENIEEHLSDEERCIMQFEILSPKGVRYLLPHYFKGKGVTHESIWNVFGLKE